MGEVRNGEPGKNLNQGLAGKFVEGSHDESVKIGVGSGVGSGVDLYLASYVSSYTQQNNAPSSYRRQLRMN